MSEEINVTVLERLALTEQLSPELQPWTQTMERHIENFKELVRHQELEVTSLGESDKADRKFVAGIIQMDVDRTKYVLASCLRRRLMKIQTQGRFLLTKLDQAPNKAEPIMSEAEKAFLGDYMKIQEIHMKQSFLVNVERGITGLGTMEEEAVTGPDLGRYVCVRVVKSILPLDIDGQTAQLGQGTIWLLPYSRISDLVKSGSVELI